MLQGAFRPYGLSCWCFYLSFVELHNTFWDDLSILTQLSGDFGSSVVLLWFIVNILYFSFYVFPVFFCIRRSSVEPRTISRSGNAWIFQHSGDGNPALLFPGSCRLFRNLEVNGFCYFPRMLMASFSTSSASCASRSSRFKRAISFCSSEA